MPFLNAEELFSSDVHVVSLFVSGTNWRYFRTYRTISLALWRSGFAEVRKHAQYSR
jgi:hypothetical protein